MSETVTVPTKNGNTKSLRIIAALISLVYLANSVPDFIQYLPRLNYNTLTTTLCGILFPLLLALALFTNNSGLYAVSLLVGCIGRAVVMLAPVILWRSDINLIALQWFLYFIALLLAYFTRPKRSIGFGLIAACAVIAAFIIYFIIAGFFTVFTVSNLINYGILIALSIMLGFIFSRQSKAAGSAQPHAEVISVETQVEKLSNLKTLLDTGVITQEEFDAKKKQILGL